MNTPYNELQSKYQQAMLDGTSVTLVAEIKNTARLNHKRP